MTITAVTVRRLKTLSGYNNVSIEATGRVEEGEDAALVRKQLDLWVQGQLEGKSAEEMQRAADEFGWAVERLQSEKERLTGEIESLKQQIMKLRKTPLGELAAAGDDGIPF